MAEFIEGVVGRLSEIFQPSLLGERLVELAANVVIGAATFAAYYLLWRLLDSILRPLLKKTNVDETTLSFLETALKYVLLTIGFLSALAAVGVNTASLLASLGIAGLTLGFAARDALSNLISGILIYWDRPFVIGDLVEVEGQYGRVDRITLRSTRVVTPDGRMLAVPNSTIINRLVASYTNFPQLRIDVPITVGVGEDLARVREILLELVRSDEDYAESPPSRVVVKELNDYNVLLEIQAWINDERRHIGKRFNLRETAFEALRRNEVQMPYETLELRPLELRGIELPGGASVSPTP